MIVTSHGKGLAGGRGAVPPNPVLAPPAGMTRLPTESVRASTFRPEEPSSTTMVVDVSPARSTEEAACAPDAVNWTVRLPGETATYDVARAKANWCARMSGA
jgi:hypothetical protein